MKNIIKMENYLIKNNIIELYTFIVSKKIVI